MLPPCKRYKERVVNLLYLSLIPVAGLLLFIYFNDKNEKEPFGLLVSLFFAGMGTVITALIAEYIGQALLGAIFPYESVGKQVVYAMLIIAPAEELGKYVVLRLITWKNKHFNYSYDAIVYAVFVSLGFAALENIGYVIGNGVSAALLRMVTAVPGHACFAVFMGFFYSKAKYASLTNGKGVGGFKALAIMVPIILHGIYDAIIFGGNVAGGSILSGMSILLWIAFCIALFVVSIIIVIKSSRNDYCIVTVSSEEGNVPEVTVTSPYAQAQRPQYVQTVYKPSIAGTWKCSCGNENTLNFCFKCGKQRAMGAVWTCPRCGSLATYNFCGNCGTHKPVQQAPSVYQNINL